MIKIVYISGAVTGRSYDEAYKQFEDAEIYLRKLGFEVINPLRYVHKDKEWKPAMKICIAKMMESDGIYMLKGFEHSQGAKIELSLAIHLNMPYDFEIINNYPFRDSKQN